MKFTDKQIKLLEKVFTDAKDYQEININPHTGQVKLTWKDLAGKRKWSKIANLFHIVEAVLPLRSYIPQSKEPKQKFYGMEKTPKNVADSNSVMWSRVAFEMEIMLNPEILKQENFVTTHYGEYREIRGKSISGYFNKSGRLVYLKDFTGKEFFVNPTYEKLETTFLVKCEGCNETFLPEKVDLYNYDHDKSGHFCKGCVPENAKKIEIK